VQVRFVFCLFVCVMPWEYVTSVTLSYVPSCMASHISLELRECIVYWQHELNLAISEIVPSFKTERTCCLYCTSIPLAMLFLRCATTSIFKSMMSTDGRLYFHLGRGTRYMVSHGSRKPTSRTATLGLITFGFFEHLLSSCPVLPGTSCRVLVWGSQDH